MSTSGEGVPFVFYLIDSLAPGGAERSLVDMAPHLVQCGIRLEVAVLLDRDGLRRELEDRGIPVHLVGGRSRGAWLYHLVKLLRATRPDLVHTTLFESDVLGRLAARAAGIPVVTTLASTPYGPEHAAEPGVRRVRLQAAQVLDAVTARLANRIHAVSQQTADVCTARLRLDPHRVEVIPRGRDLTRLGARTSERSARVRGELGIPVNEPMLIAVARHEPPKGLDVLIHAMKLVLSEFPGAILMVAGRPGRATADLERTMIEAGVSQSVRLLGNREDVADLLVAADAFVIPSRREGLPGAVLEAMALEVPIVASDLPTIREAVPSDEYAFFVPVDSPPALADELLRLLRRPEDGESKVRAAKHRFDECFAIGPVARAMADFYLRVLGWPRP